MRTFGLCVNARRGFVADDVACLALHVMEEQLAFLKLLFAGTGFGILGEGEFRVVCALEIAGVVKSKLVRFGQVGRSVVGFEIVGLGLGVIESPFAQAISERPIFYFAQRSELCVP